MLDRLLTGDDVADIEGSAEAFCSFYQSNCPLELVERATGHPPIFSRMSTPGRYFGGRVYISDTLSPQRARQACGHELSHVHDEQRGWDGPLREVRADCFSGCVLAPRRDVISCLKRHGRHSYKGLAEDFDITQSMAILRLAEVTGRPVLLLSPMGPIARGVDFRWPSISALVRSLDEYRSNIHYAKIQDEPDRHAFMVQYEVWRTLAA